MDTLSGISEELEEVRNSSKIWLAVGAREILLSDTMFTGSTALEWAWGDFERFI